MLNEFSEQLKPMFYVDKYDPDAYTNVVMYSDCDTSFKMAEPEAFGVNPGDGKIFLRKEADGRPLYKEIIGKDFAERFNQYRDMFFNYGFGETTENLIQAILRHSVVTTVDGKEVTITGEQILKDGYTKTREKLLLDLSDKRRHAVNPDDKRLYNIFFTIIWYMLHNLLN